MTDPTWRDVALRAVAMCAHLDARARVAELRADALQTQRDAAVADNAALLAWVNEHGHRIGDRLCPHTGAYACEPGCDAHLIHTTPHPGAVYRAKVRAEILRELALERRAVLAYSETVSNDCLAEHFEHLAAHEEAASRGGA